MSELDFLQITLLLLWLPSTTPSPNPWVIREYRVPFFPVTNVSEKLRILPSSVQLQTALTVEYNHLYNWSLSFKCSDSNSGDELHFNNGLIRCCTFFEKCPQQTAVGSAGLTGRAFVTGSAVRGCPGRHSRPWEPLQTLGAFDEVIPEGWLCVPAYFCLLSALSYCFWWLLFLATPSLILPSCLTA